MSENKKSYYAIIPASVRYDERLPDKAKLLYGEITALSNENGYCWASNKYFADLYKVHKNSISRLISELKKRGHIEIEIIYKKSREIKERKIYPINNNINSCKQKCEEGINKIVIAPTNKIVKDNITINNITINNKDIYKKILNHWNEKKLIRQKDSVFYNQMLTSKLKQLKKEFKTLLTDYSFDEIKSAIDNYEYVLNSKNHYWCHKWTLADFLIRGLSRFVNDADPKENFKKYNTVEYEYEKEYKNNKKNSEYLAKLG